VLRLVVDEDPTEVASLATDTSPTSTPGGRAILVTPAELSFGDTPVHAVGKSMSVIVENTGELPVEVRSVAVDGADQTAISAIPSPTRSSWAVLLIPVTRISGRVHSLDAADRCDRLPRRNGTSRR